ncbi:MAG: hypothetical protein ACKOCM_02045 [Cyanobacteriota bacterium]|nr:hypothetical protein [Cyanobacteria bacterium K_DeepCast_35m_m2_023]
MTTPTAELQPVHWNLPQGLVSQIEALASAECCSPEVIASRILLAGVAETGLTAAGRCSVRTGLCSEGPTPLPIQQI